MLRAEPYAAVREMSVKRRMAEAAREPRDLPELLTWFRREWDAECPSRTHERGVEPQSALGSPKLAGAFRSYITGSPMATDHDDRLDVDMRDAARLRPIHAALSHHVAQVAHVGALPVRPRVDGRRVAGRGAGVAHVARGRASLHEGCPAAPVADVGTGPGKNAVLTLYGYGQ